MIKYHINDKGNATKCSAEVGKCPFGSDAPHFDNKQDAEKHYEDSFPNVFEQVKPVKKMKVYRVGTLTAPEEYFDDLNSLLQDVDKFKPEGRQGRHGGIFASPDLASHGRWVRGNEYNKHEGALDSHEITVDANSVYVYDVNAYEKASSIQSMYGSESEKFKEAAESLWNSGMLLSDWHEWAKENKPERGSWEIIMPASSIMSSKKMSNRSVIESVGDVDVDELNRILEPNRYRKGLKWRKNPLNDELRNKIDKKAAEHFEEDFVKDMRQVFSKNYYTRDDLYSARKEIYGAINRLKKKRSENVQTFAQLSREEQYAFGDKLDEYVKFVEEILASEDN